jgi:hypothetical protein
MANTRIVNACADAADVIVELADGALVDRDHSVAATGPGLMVPGRLRAEPGAS